MTFQWAEEIHASVLNAKFDPIPAEYVSALDDLLVENGYRFVIDELSHPPDAEPGEEIQIITDWSNLGVAPSCNRRTLSYRLENRRVL